MTKRFLFSFLWVVILSISAVAQTKSYDLKVGDSYDIESSIDQVISQMIMGTSQDITSKSNSSENLEVINIENGLYTLKLTTLSISTEVNSPMGTQKISSENDGMLSPLKNTSYSFTMDKYGTVGNITDFESIKQAAETAVASNPAAAGQLSSYLDEQTIKENLSNRFAIYNAEGKTEWSISKEVEMNGVPLKISTTYTLNGTGISSKGSLNVEGTTTNMGMEVSMKMDGTQNGSYTLNSSTGMPVKAVTKSEISGNASTQGMTIPMTITTDMTTTITKK